MTRELAASRVVLEAKARSRACGRCCRRARWGAPPSTPRAPAPTPRMPMLTATGGASWLSLVDHPRACWRRARRSAWGCGGATAAGALAAGQLRRRRCARGCATSTSRCFSTPWRRSAPTCSPPSSFASGGSTRRSPPPARPPTPSVVGVGGRPLAPRGSRGADGDGRHSESAVRGCSRSLRPAHRRRDAAAAAAGRRGARGGIAARLCTSSRWRRAHAPARRVHRARPRREGALRKGRPRFDAILAEVATKQGGKDAVGVQAASRAGIKYELKAAAVASLTSSTTRRSISTRRRPSGCSRCRRRDATPAVDAARRPPVFPRARRAVRAVADRAARSTLAGAVVERDAMDVSLRRLPAACSWCRRGRRQRRPAALRGDAPQPRAAPAHLQLHCLGSVDAAGGAFARGCAPRCNPARLGAAAEEERAGGVALGLLASSPTAAVGAAAQTPPGAAAAARHRRRPRRGVARRT